MYAVIFEVQIKEGCKEEYLKLGAAMRERINQFEGFISAERFTSVTTQGKVCSLSFWKDEESIKCWREDFEHHACQQQGKESLFDSFRIRVAKVERDYQMGS